MTRLPGRTMPMSRVSTASTVWWLARSKKRRTPCRQGSPVSGSTARTRIQGGAWKSPPRGTLQSWLDSSLIPYSPTRRAVGNARRSAPVSSASVSARWRPLKPPVTITIEPAGRGQTASGLAASRSAKANAVPGTKIGAQAACSASQAAAAWMPLSGSKNVGMSGTNRWHM